MTTPSPPHPALPDPAPLLVRHRLVETLAHGWGRLRRNMTLGVRGLAINAEGSILLLRHTYTPGWHMPGGGVEVGETFEQALAREMEEEAALRIRGRPRLHGLFLNMRLARRDHIAVYAIEAFELGAWRVPNREIAEIGFFAPDALPAATSAATRRRIAEISDGRPPEPLW